MVAEIVSVSRKDNLLILKRGLYERASRMIDQDTVEATFSIWGYVYYLVRK